MAETRKHTTTDTRHEKPIQTVLAQRAYFNDSPHILYLVSWTLPTPRTPYTPKIPEWQETRESLESGKVSLPAFDRRLNRPDGTLNKPRALARPIGVVRPPRKNQKPHVLALVLAPSASAAIEDACLPNAGPETGSLAMAHNAPLLSHVPPGAVLDATPLWAWESAERVSLVLPEGFAERKARTLARGHLMEMDHHYRVVAPPDVHPAFRALVDQMRQLDCDRRRRNERERHLLFRGERKAAGRKQTRGRQPLNVRATFPPLPPSLMAPLTTPPATSTDLEGGPGSAADAFYRALSVSRSRGAELRRLENATTEQLLAEADGLRAIGTREALSRAYVAEAVAAWRMYHAALALPPKRRLTNADIGRTPPSSRAVTALKHWTHQHNPRLGQQGVDLMRAMARLRQDKLDQEAHEKHEAVLRLERMRAAGIAARQRAEARYAEEVAQATQAIDGPHLHVPSAQVSSPTAPETQPISIPPELLARATHPGAVIALAMRLARERRLAAIVGEAADVPDSGAK